MVRQHSNTIEYIGHDDIMPCDMQLILMPLCLFVGRRIFTDAWVCATAGNDSAKSDQRAEQSRSQQSRTSLNQTKDNKSIVRVPAPLLSLAANKRTSQEVDDAISHVCRRSSNFLFKLFKFSQS